MMRTVWRWLGKGVAAAVVLILLYQLWLFAHVLWWIDHNPDSTSFMEAGLARPFDPTLVPLPDGRMRLYFTSNRSRDFSLSTPAIYSVSLKAGTTATGLDFGDVQP